MISLIYTVLCIACLCVGFFCGYRLNNEKPIHIQNPITTVKEKMETKKIEDANKERLEELNTILENIENYDGTSQGQKELKNVGTGL